MESGAFTLPQTTTLTMSGPRRGSGMLAAFTAAALAAFAAFAGSAGAQFTVAGRKVPPIETNFAGVRQVSPRYGLIVQINHDAQPGGDFELGVVDETYASLLTRFRRAPVIRADLLPLVIVSEAKIARFGEGGRRRMFRWLEADLGKHPDMHLSPAGIFVSDRAVADREKLRSTLAVALGFLFDQRFRSALDSLDPPQPDR
jgi:hypothetical protein